MRLFIAGPPGSGKTTLARHLGRMLDVPVHHLDRCFWRPGWRKVSSEQRAAILDELMQGESWVIEGSYLHCQQALIAAADMVLVMRTPRLVCVWRVFKRHWTRTERGDLPQGCRDRLSAACLWKIVTYSDRRAASGKIKYPQTREENAMPDPLTKTKQKVLHVLARRFPGRVLRNIRFEYYGFQVFFDLPRKRRLDISVSAYAKENGTIEVYETAKGSDSHRYWLIDGNSYTIEGTDPLPLLESYLKTTIGGVEHGYEGSFAEMILASFRNKKEE